MKIASYRIKALLIASVIVAVPSCAGRDSDVNFLPPAPPQIEKDQAGDPRPEYPQGAVDSEDLHENWVSDALDWGDRRDLLAYRWCELWNKFAKEPVDCGVKPPGVDGPR